MSCLKTLPVDQLKIDRSFVCDLLSDTQDADIACTIVPLAHALKLEVIVQDVETRAQCERLSSFGCTCFQGYYFDRPAGAAGAVVCACGNRVELSGLSARALDRWLRASRARQSDQRWLRWLR